MLLLLSAALAAVHPESSDNKNAARPNKESPALVEDDDALGAAAE